MKAEAIMRGIICIVLVATVISSVVFAEGRTWTDQKGRKANAEFVSFENGKVRLRRTSDGKTFSVPIESLSDADQEYVKSEALADVTKAEATPQSEAKTSSSKTNVAELIRALKEGDTETRKKAITQLGRVPSPNEQVVASLVDAMGVVEEFEMGSGNFTMAGKKPSLLGSCCEALLNIGSSGRDHIVAGFGHENKWVRYGCAWVAGRIKDKSIASTLVQAAKKEKDDDVKREVVFSLALLGDYESALDVCKSINSVNTAATAYRQLLTLLAQTQKNIAAKVCIELGDESKPAELRDVAADVAGLLTDSDTLRMLIRLSKSPSNVPGAVVDWHACRSLGLRRAEEAKQQLADLALDESTKDGTRVQAAWALARLNDNRGIEVLRAVANSSSFAKSQAKEAIANIENGEPIPGLPEVPSTDRFEGRFENVGGGLMVFIE